MEILAALRQLFFCSKLWRTTESELLLALPRLLFVEYHTALLLYLQILMSYPDCSVTNNH